jgi:L-fuconolactonase
MKALAKREKLVGMKFSGLLIEFPAGEGDAETVAACFHGALEIFGSDKVMFGTDWPGCLLRTIHKDWADGVH